MTRSHCKLVHALRARGSQALLSPAWATRGLTLVGVGRFRLAGRQAAQVPANRIAWF